MKYVRKSLIINLTNYNRQNQLSSFDDKLLNQIGPQGAEKQLSRIRVVVGGWCRGQTPILLLISC